MGQFLNQLCVTPVDDGRNWRLLTDFEYQTNAGDIITAERDFVTDFASVPKMFWDVVPPWGLWGWASVIHDKLYRTSGLNGKYTRAVCDGILYTAMLDKGTPKETADIIYDAVRLGGQAAWDEDAKNLEVDNNS